MGKRFYKKIIQIIVIASIVIIMLMLLCSNLFAMENNTYYVKTKEDLNAWNDKPPEKVFNDIQEAIEMASKNTPSEVLVAIGTYYPSSSPNISGETPPENHHFSLKNGVRVVGGFRGNESNNIPTYKNRLSDSKHTIISGHDTTKHVFYHPENARLDNQAILENVTITKGNSPQGQGGGMYNCESSPMLISCIFKENMANEGGAIYNQYSMPQILECTFQNNKATQRGGAVYNKESNSVFINCKFNLNSASYGGAIVNTNSSPKINSCLFNKNYTGENDGGAVYNENLSSPHISNSVFTENKSLHYGGAISNESSNPTISNCYFMKNNALYGGGIYNSSSNVMLTNSSFIGNFASDGGGIYGEKNSKHTIASCSFTRNNSTNGGGAIFIYLSSAQIGNTAFTENIAANGGGICNTGGDIKLLNSLFAGNHAKEFGGGLKSGSVSSSDSRLDIVNCTFGGNTTEQDYHGGGIYTSDYNLSVTNTIISGNKSGEGYSDFLKDSSSPEPIFDSNIVGENFYQNYSSITNVGFDSKNHFNWDYSLIDDSNPAIDMGNNEVFENMFTIFNSEINPNKKLKSYDLSGCERILYNNNIDIGAFESNSQKKDIIPPVPEVMAFSKGSQYISDSKTNSTVSILTNINVESMDNFPIVPKYGYLDFKTVYENNSTAYPYLGQIEGDASTQYTFLTKLDDETKSDKVAFNTNMDWDKPSIKTLQFGSLSEAASVPISTREIIATFSKNMRSTSGSALMLYSINSANGNEEVEIADLTTSSSAIGNSINIKLNDNILRYGEKYMLGIYGFKDDYNNIMEDYKAYFITETPPDNFEPVVSGVIANQLNFPSSGGQLSLTVGGGNLQYVDNIKIADNLMTYNAVAIPEGYKAISDPISIPKNIENTPKTYEYKVFMDEIDTQKNIRVSVDAFKPIATFLDVYPESDYITTSSAFVFGEGKGKTYELSINGKPFNTTEIYPSDGKYIVELNSVDGLATVVISSQVLSDLKSSNENFELVLKTALGSYFMPAKLPEIISGLDQLLVENGLMPSDISFCVEIKHMGNNSEVLRFIDENLNMSDGRPDWAVDFKLKILGKDGKIVQEAVEFIKPIKRTAVLPIGKEAKNNTAVFALVNNVEGRKFSFVPHRAYKEDGENIIEIKSYGNHVYFIGDNNKSFSDTDGHWGEENISRAASLGLVFGNEMGSFEPDRELTRAEFIAMIVNGLGLNKVSTNEIFYNDVNRGDWYFQDIMTARVAGLLNGFNNSSFLPNENITREEMASIINGVFLYENIGTESNSYLDVSDNVNFTDMNDISDGYLFDVKAVASNGVMSGFDGGAFYPKGFATKAQATVTLVKMLELLGNI